MNNIDFGDKVRHKTDNKYNAFLMTVEEVENDKFICQYVDMHTHETKTAEFTENEIELVEKADGGFIS